MPVPQTQPAGASEGLRTILESLAASPDAEGEVARLARDLADALIPAPTGPLVSVLMRTQGRRIESLRDAMLCLAAQSDDDFETLVLVHDPDEATLEAVSAVVDDHRPILSGPIRVEVVRGGGRTRPLNVGVKLARGRYITALDDDDLVFAHWIESFRQGAAAAPGSIVRTICMAQDVEDIPWSGGRAGFRSASLPRADYTADFDLIHHLQVNHTPFMSVAFPATVFRSLGLRFDETLPVLEDWDLLLRTASLVGVSDVHSATSIYRRWHAEGRSIHVHPESEWAEARSRVIAGLDSAPFLLPAGSASRLRRLVADENAAGVLEGLVASRSWRWLLRGRATLAPVLRPTRRVVRGALRRWRGRT